MVEENRGGCPESVVFTVGMDELEPQLFGESVGALGTGRGRFVLIVACEVAEHFGAACEDQLGLRRVIANGGCDVREAEHVGFDRFAGMLDAAGDRALGGQVVDLVELVEADEFVDEILAGDIAFMKDDCVALSSFQLTEGA